jgi:cytochrome oxidase Cu insertion factor (SCO1/SenC/PrrC family)
MEFISYFIVFVVGLVLGFLVAALAAAAKNEMPKPSKAGECSCGGTLEPAVHRYDGYPCIYNERYR